MKASFLQKCFLRQLAAGFLLTLAAILSIAADAAEPPDPKIPDPVQMLRQMDLILRGNSHQMIVDFYVKTPDWERRYKLHVWMKGLDYAFSRLLEPAKVKGQGFLRVKFRAWSYLPAAERTILIPPSLMPDKILGSNFSIDDLMKLSYLPRDYTAVIAGEESIEGTDSYHLELKPKPNAPVYYEKLGLWLRKKDFAPLRLEFYDEKLRHIRTLHYSGFHMFQGLERPTVWRMVNHKIEDRESTITVLKADYETDVPDSFFTRENLEKTL